MKAERILAIDPGTKELGVAVLEGLDLLYYGVKTIKRPRTPQEILGEAAATISRLIALYHPDVLAVEKTFLIQKSAALLNVVAEEIKATARQAGLQVYEYAPTTIRKHLCTTGKATKQQTARVVATRYPELVRYLAGRTRWEELYYANLFDALAVGLYCYDQLTTPNSQQDDEGISGS